MKTQNKGIATGLAAWLVFSSCAFAWADGYRDLSDRLMRSAELNSLKKIAVLEFSGKGGAGKADTDYAAEKIGLYLAGSRTTALIERALLASVLRETRLSSAAGASDKAEILKGMLDLDAVVTGVVFPDGERLTVLARLIDLKTGRVLLAAEADGDRLPPEMLGGDFSGMEPPVVPFPELPGAWGNSGGVVARETFRDAVADSSAKSCGDRRRLLSKLNGLLVDAKARYWAIYMKAPGYSRLHLKRNPGSEIGDPGVKASFYKRLASYYESGMELSLEQEKLSAVLALLKMEKETGDECGHN
jgi:TolB-like protein